MTIDARKLGAFAPSAGWPYWTFSTPYSESAHPQGSAIGEMEHGANCQRYAYAVLELFGKHVPPHRSSELFSDPDLDHISPEEAIALDLILFNHNPDPWGAHIAVITPAGLLHLCAEAETPALWQWSDFASRTRYRTIVGAVRATH